MNQQAENSKANAAIDQLERENRPLTAAEIRRGDVHATHVPACWCNTCAPPLTKTQ